MAICVEKTRCYWRFTTRLFPRIFSYLPFDYRAENVMYSYIHRCLTLLTIKTSISTIIFLAPHIFLGSRLPCLWTISKRFHQSLIPPHPPKKWMNLISNRLSTASIKYLNWLSSVFGQFQNGCNKVVIEPHIVQFWSEIILVISNRTGATCSFDFEITCMISTQIALHSVQLPLFTWRK